MLTKLSDAKKRLTRIGDQPMNKYLMMMAAVLLAEAPSTDASASGKHANIQLSGSWCSTFALNWNANTYVLNVDELCIDNSVNEIGIAGRTMGLGKNVNFAFPDPETNIPLSLDLQLPVKTGNKWTLYVYNQGSVSVLNSGTYQVGNNGARPAGGQRESLAGLVRKMLETRKSVHGKP